jgi:hypothetical protein
VHEDAAPREPLVADNDERSNRKAAIKADNAERKAHPQKAQSPRREDRSRHEDRNARQRREDDDGTIGFGDDMPAFMKIAVKV